MKQIILFGLIIIVNISCSNQQKEYPDHEQSVLKNITPDDDAIYDSINPLMYPDSLRIYVRKANLLSKFYELRETDREKYEKLFFDEFPPDFRSFEVIYGNVMLDYGLQNILGLKSDQHISDFLFNLKFVERKTFIEKMLNVSAAGKWDSDGVSVFQKKLRNIVVTNANVVFPILDPREDRYIEDVFFFLFDGPHPPNDLPTEFKALQKEYPKIIKLAENGLKKAKEPHPIGR